MAPKKKSIKTRRKSFIISPEAYFSTFQRWVIEVSKEMNGPGKPTYGHYWEDWLAKVIETFAYREETDPANPNQMRTYGDPENEGRVLSMTSLKNRHKRINKMMMMWCLENGHPPRVMRDLTKKPPAPPPQIGWGELIGEAGHAVRPATNDELEVPTDNPSPGSPKPE